MTRTPSKTAPKAAAKKTAARKTAAKPETGPEAGPAADPVAEVTPPPYVAPAGSELELKAPNRHRKRMEMLSHMPKGGRCAEVGVWNGGFSDFILQETRPVELILIDPWDMLSERPEGEQTHHRHGDEGFMGSMRDHVAAKFADRPEVKLHQGFSAEVLEELPDDYLDWIYIDGNHRYEFVRKDLAVAARKVREGGIIAGDDLFWKRDERMQVREAVWEFLEGAGLRRKVEHIGQQFMIPVGPEIKKAYAS